MSKANTETATKPMPLKNFDESIGLDDPRPFPSWEPSPRQIAEWAAQIREEREAERIDEP